MGEGISTDDEWVDAMRDTTRSLARAQYAHVETVTAFYRRGVAADLARAGGWHTAKEGATATALAAVMMRMSEYAVTGLVDVGLSLAGLPCTKQAFAVGDLDLARVRAIVDVTTGCTEEVRLELDRRLADLGRSCAVPGLRSTGRRWAAKLDPASVAERRKRTVQDRDVKITAARDGMAILDGWLPVEAAQVLAHRLADMAKQQVCAADPRTFPQRRADALVALADGTGRLVCGCDLGTECPKAGGDPATPAAPVIQVGVSLETLLGLRDWPGYLAGTGAIDPDLARILAKDGRWEWIIAAIDAAATLTNSDTGNDPAAGVCDSRADSAHTTGAGTTTDRTDTEFAADRADTEFTGGSADAEPADGRAETEPTDDRCDAERATQPAGNSAGGQGADGDADAADGDTAPGAGHRSPQDATAGTAAPHAGDNDESACTASVPDDTHGSDTDNEPDIDVAEAPDLVDATTAPQNAAPEQESPGGDPPDTSRPPPHLESGNDSSTTGSVRRRIRMSAAARRAIAAACMATIGGWDDPDTEAALRYAWPEKLANWIRARDLTCRFPNCRVPARNCDIDHSIRYDHSEPRKGGRTVRTNAACLCRRHHRVKTDGENGRGGWRVSQVDGRGRLAWTTPTGEIIFTDPEGAEFLWPEPDLIISPPSPPARSTPDQVASLRVQDEQIAAQYGLELTDTTTIGSRYDETAECDELLAAAYPRRRADLPDADTGTPGDDDPPPF